MWWPFQSQCATAVLMEILRLISSGSKSVVVVPSSIFPRRDRPPAVKSRDSTRDVLPTPPWPTTPTFRSFPISIAIDRPPGASDAIEARCYHDLRAVRVLTTVATTASSEPARSIGGGSGGGSYLMPAP